MGIAIGSTIVSNSVLKELKPLIVPIQICHRKQLIILKVIFMKNPIDKFE